MANHASAIKRARQRIKRTDRNRAAKSELRSALKKARAGLTAPDAVKSAASALDRAASKGTIPARRASRQKGRIAAAAHRAAKAGG